MRKPSSSLTVVLYAVVVIGGFMCAPAAFEQGPIYLVKDFNTDVVGASPVPIPRAPMAGESGARGSSDLREPSAGAVFQEAYGQLPIAFEPNRGQTDPGVDFVARGRGYALFVSSRGAVLRLAGESTTDPEAASAPPSTGRTADSDKARNRATLRMTLLGGKADARASMLGELAGKVSYFTGRDPALWRTHIPTYQRVEYQDVYPRVDLVYYGTQQHLEYDFVVQPGGDPQTIALAFDGSSGLEVDERGDLVMRMAAGMVRQRKPDVYQELNGIRQPVAGRYRLLSSNRVGFEIGAYDRTRPLVIDPVLLYATYFGGTQGDEGWGIAVDSTGAAYVVGNTFSANLPVSAGTLDESHNGGATDSFVMKLNADGSGIVYSTYLGGSDSEEGQAIAVDHSGAAYVTGGTASTNFPVTSGAFDTTLGGMFDAFVAKLSPDGHTLQYSAYLGGSGDDRGRGVALDAAGNAYVTGFTVSANFPTTAGSFETVSHGAEDAFVAKINSTGASLVYAALLGGSSSDFGFGIDVDVAGNAYVTGRTLSADFPTSVGAFDTTLGGAADAFVTKVDTLGATLAYSTLLGGSAFDQGFRLSVDSLGAAHVAGLTLSGDFVTTPGAFDRTFGGGASGDVFVTRLNAAGSALAYSTFLGGGGPDFAGGIDVDVEGYTYITGVTASSDFPTTANAPDTSANGGNDVFVTKLTPNGSTLVYSTYLGGAGQEESRALAIDTNGAAYVTGITGSAAFPTTSGAFDPTFNDSSGSDAFVVKLGEPPQSGPVVLDQSFEPNDYLGGAVSGAGYSIGGSLSQSLAQTFPVGFTGRLVRVEVKIGGFGGPTQPIVADIRRTVLGRPLENDGDVLAQVTLPASAVPLSPNPAGYVAIDLSNDVVRVSAGDVVAVVLWSGEQVGSYVWQGVSTANPPASPLYPRGSQFFRHTNSPTWSNPVVADLGFKTFIDTSALPVDLTAPVLTLPDPIRVPAASASGAAVTFTAAASDDTDPSPVVACTPLSGSTFPLGSTLVTCTATDASGNSSQGSFTVTVFDDVRPILNNMPSDLILEATGPTGAVASWPSPTANDDVDGAVSVTCSRPSGSTFGLGTITVTCGAADSSGNSVSATFKVTVRDTIVPLVAIVSPDRNAVLTASPAVVRIQASDLVGVTAVNVNGIAAVLTGGSAQSGTWDAQVPIQVANVALTFTTTAQDGSANPSSATMIVDNDGIAADIDRTLAGTDQSSVYSSEFSDGVTRGVFSASAGVRFTATKLPAGGVRLAVQGDSSLSADVYLCASSKYVRLNGGEVVDVLCATNGTVTVKAVTASPSVELYKQTSFTVYDSYRYCFPVTYSCGALGRSTCSYMSCSTTTVTRTYWYWYSIPLSTGQAASTGSPVTASPSNTGPIRVTLLRIQEDETEIPVGSLELDPGESADVEITQRADGEDEINVIALTGNILATIGGITRTVAQGQQDARSTDLVAPIIGAVSDMTVETTSTNGAVVNYSLPSATDNVDPLPVVSGAPPPGSLFPLGETPVTATAVDASGNGSSATFKITVRLPPPPGYVFQGFFAPLDSPPTMNRMKAGSGVPVKFSLTGNFGLTVLQAGYPMSQPMPCQGGALDDVEQTVTAGSSSLSYDALTDQYTYVWKTDKAWAGTCRQFVLKLSDGTLKTALFAFTK